MKVCFCLSHFGHQYLFFYRISLIDTLVSITSSMPCFPCCLLHCSGAEAAALIRRLLLLTGIDTQIDHANMDVHEPLLQERANRERPVHALWSEEVIQREQRRLERRLESIDTDWPTSPRFSDKESCASDCVHISAVPQQEIPPLRESSDNASAATSERPPPLKTAVPKPPPKGFEVSRNPCFYCRKECGLGMKTSDPSPEWPKAGLPKHSPLSKQPPALTKPPASSR